MSALHGESYFVIDIGNKNIKMLHGKFAKDKFIIGEYEIIPTPNNSVRDGKIIDLDTLISVIRPFHADKKKAKIIFNISGSGIIVREIMLPKASHDEIYAMLDFEAAQYFPGDFLEYSYDFKILEEVANPEGKDGKGVMLRVQVAGVLLKTVEAYMELQQQLGSRIETIDIHANTLTKAVNILYPKAYTDEAKTIAILDIGHETMQVVINYKGILKFAKMLPRGSHYIEEVLGEGKHLDAAAFEEMKLNFKGSPTDEEKKLMDPEAISIAENVENAVGRMMEEVSNYFDFYHSRSGKERIKKIILSGGGSKMTGMLSYVSEYFPMSVEVLGEFENVEYLGTKSKEEFHQDRFYLLSLIGNLKREKK